MAKKSKKVRAAEEMHVEDQTTIKTRRNYPDQSLTRRRRDESLVAKENIQSGMRQELSQSTKHSSKTNQTSQSVSRKDNQSVVKKEMIPLAPKSRRHASRESEKTLVKTKERGKTLRRYEDTDSVTSSVECIVTQTKKGRRRGERSRARSVEVKGRTPVRTIDSSHHYLKLKKPPKVPMGGYGVPPHMTSSYGSYSTSQGATNDQVYEKHHYSRVVRDDWNGVGIRAGYDDHEYEIPVTSFEHNESQFAPTRSILKNTKVAEDFNSQGSFSNLRYIDLQSPKPIENFSEEKHEEIRNETRVVTPPRGRRPLNENLSWKNQFSYMHPACRRKGEFSEKNVFTEEENYEQVESSLENSKVYPSSSLLYSTNVGYRSDDSFDSVGVKPRKARSVSAGGKVKKQVRIDSSALPTSRENVISGSLSSSSSSMGHESYLEESRNDYENYQSEALNKIRSDPNELQRKKLSKQPVSDDVMMDILTERDVGVKRHICFMNAGKCPNCEDDRIAPSSGGIATSPRRSDNFWIKNEEHENSFSGDFTGSRFENEVHQKESVVVSALKKQFDEAAKDTEARSWRSTRTEEQEINI